MIGNAAGGKSTLARHLARRRELPLIEVTSTDELDGFVRELWNYEAL